MKNENTVFEHAQPDREPDYISKRGSKYWFKELIYWRDGPFSGSEKMFIHEGKVHSEFAKGEFINEIQIAFKNYIEECLINGFPDSTIYNIGDSHE